MLGFSVPIPDLSILRVAAALLSAPVQSLARSDCLVLRIVAAVIALYSLLLLLERLLLGCDPKHQHPAQTPWTVATVHTNSRNIATGDTPAHIFGTRIRCSVFPHAPDLCIWCCRVLLLCRFALFFH